MKLAGHYPGIDIKSDGGYIVAEPSVTTGNYAWLDCPDDMPTMDMVAVAPPWMIDLASGRATSPIQQTLAPAPIAPTLLPEYEWERIASALAYCFDGDDNRPRWLDYRRERQRQWNVTP